MSKISFTTNRTEKGVLIHELETLMSDGHEIIFTAHTDSVAVNYTTPDFFGYLAWGLASRIEIELDNRADAASKRKHTDRVRGAGSLLRRIAAADGFVMDTERLTLSLIEKDYRSWETHVKNISITGSLI